MFLFLFKIWVEKFLIMVLDRESVELVKYKINFWVSFNI